MNTYELVDVAGFCRHTYDKLVENGTAKAFLFVILKGRSMSFDKLFNFLAKLDIKHSPSLEQKLVSLWKKPKAKIEPFGHEEMLLLLARLQNAAWRIPRMQGESRMTIECPSAAEAMIWATTRFWRTTATDVLMSIASDYLHGGDSFSS